MVQIYPTSKYGSFYSIIIGAGGIISDGPIIIDVNSTEALLVRKNADGGDVFAVNTNAENILLNDLGTLKATSSKGLIVTGATLTTSGTDDVGLEVNQTLNASGPSGSDVYRGIKYNLTATDASGWDEIYLFDLQINGLTNFRVNTAGDLELTGNIEIESDNYIVFDGGQAFTGWNTDQTNPALITAVSNSNSWILATNSNISNNRDLGLANQTDPSLVITSATGWDSATDEYLLLAYNTLNFGAGNVTMTHTTDTLAIGGTSIKSLNLNTNGLWVGGTPNVTTGILLSLQASATNCDFLAETYSNTASNEPRFRFFRARGTPGAGALPTQDGDSLFSITALGYANGAFRSSAIIFVAQQGAVSGNNVPSRLVMGTVNASSGFTRAFEIDSNQNVGIGVLLESVDRRLHVQQSDSSTNTVTYVQRLTHISSGTVAASFGVGTEFELENASNTNRIAATQEVSWINATNNSEDAAYILKLMIAGAAATEKLRLDPIDGLKITTLRFQEADGGSIASANDLTLNNNGNKFTITGTTQINAITIANWQSGSEIVLKFSGALTVKHNTAGGAGTAPLLLAGSVDLITAANTILKIYYDGTNWQEIARKVA